MELRERLMQSAEWCDANEHMLERIKHIAQDLRDAAAEIDAMEKSRMNFAAEVRSLRRQVETLEEQLQMAKTEAKDVGEFRERERKEAELIVIGLRMAIQSIVHGMKGGK